MRWIGKTVPAAQVVFRNRSHAGKVLAEAVRAVRDPNALVLAVPRGGVPVALPLAEALDAPLGLIMVRKLPIPFSPEAGFGAVALDGSVVLNEPMVRRLHLAASQIDSIVQDVLAEVRRRARQYMGHDRPPEAADKHAYVVDDGLASGYTMMAAALMIRKQHPTHMTLCVPVSPLDSIEAVEPYFDDLYCLVAQERTPFAVASFYQDFHDLTDDELRRLLRSRSSAASSAPAHTNADPGP